MKRTVLAAMVLCILTAAGNAAARSGVIFHVSEAGNDAWSGKPADPNAAGTDGPFLTLGRARDAIRSLKRSKGLPRGGVEIRIRGGVYPLEQTFTLTAGDSGAKGSPVVWRAFPGETVQFAGGREVTGFAAVDDPAALERLDPAARGKVLRADLKSIGIGEYGVITNRSGPGLELFFQNRRMTLARWPNDEWAKIADVPQTGELVNKGELPHMRFGLPIGKHYGRFEYDGDRPSRWKDVDEIVLHGYWVWDWYDEFLHVKRIDPATHEIWPADPQSHYGYCKEQRWYAFNVLEELDRPGEWYLDRKNGIVYFWPPAPLSDGRVFASVLDKPLVSLEGADYVTVRGLTLEFSRGPGIAVKGGAHNLVAGCTVRNLGGTAVIIDGGVDNGVTSCDMYDLAAGGINVNGGDRKTLAPAGNFAANNHIRNYSAWIRTYQSAITVNGVGNRIAHNLIHDAPHSGIMLGGNEHMVEYNELHTLAQQTGDVGAFYMGRDWTQRGNIIRYNYFHDLLGPGLHGVMAVYLDDWSSGTTIFGNIFVRAGRAAFIGGGRDNTVENNIFYDCAPSVHVDARGLGWAKYYFDKSMDIYVNTLFDRMDDMKFREPPYSARYPELLKLYGDDPAVPKNNRVLRNISAGGRWIDLYDGVDLNLVTVNDNVIADGALVQRLVPAENKLVTFPASDTRAVDEFTAAGNLVLDGDPGFVDAAGRDFRLKKNSPAFKKGFTPIPFAKIGLVPDEYRPASKKR